MNEEQYHWGYVQVRKDRDAAEERVGRLRIELDAANARIASLEAALALAIDDFDWAGSMYDGVVAYLHVHGRRMTAEQIERAKVARQHRSVARTLLHLEEVAGEEKP